jgi:hypothetical protein
MKHQLSFTGLHGIISQNTDLFIDTAVRTSNTTKFTQTIADAINALHYSKHIPDTPVTHIHALKLFLGNSKPPSIHFLSVLQLCDGLTCKPFKL